MSRNFLFIIPAMMLSASVFAQPEPGTQSPALDVKPPALDAITADKVGSNAEKFTRLFDRSEVWLGADGIYSIPLDSNDNWGSAKQYHAVLQIDNGRDTR